MTYRGERHRLETCDVDDAPDGPHYLRALDEFQRVIREASSPVKYGDRTVKGCVHRWLEHVERQNERTADKTRSLLRRFVLRLGHMDIAQMAALDVRKWVDSQKTWKDSTKRNAWDRLKTCLKWNRQNSFSPVNPLAEYPTPANYNVGKRGVDFVLPGPLLDLLLAEAKGAFRDLIFSLSETGARPAELTNAVRENYRPDRQVIVHRGDEQKLYVWKNARNKKGSDRDRTIVLEGDVLGIVERNRRRGGLLFPSMMRRRYSAANLQGHWDRLLDRPKVSEWMGDNGKERRFVVPYSLRHTWITNAVKNRVEIKAIADLVGTSVEMIEKHYCHSSSDADYMRDAYQRAKAKR